MQPCLPMHRLGETGMRSTGPRRWPSSNSWIGGESAAISSTIPETSRWLASPWATRKLFPGPEVLFAEIAIDLLQARLNEATFTLWLGWVAKTSTMVDSILYVTVVERIGKNSDVSNPCIDVMLAPRVLPAPNRHRRQHTLGPEL